MFIPAWRPCMLGRRSRPAPILKDTCQRPPLIGICLLLQIRVSDGRVADTYMIQDDFVHLNHSNAPHLYEDRLVILGVSPLQHGSWDASPSTACMHIFTFFVRSAPASITRPSAGGLHILLHCTWRGSKHMILRDVYECHCTDTSTDRKHLLACCSTLTHSKISAEEMRLVNLHSARLA